MRSYKLLTVFGIPIKVSISLLVLLPILAWLIGSGQQIELYSGLIDSLSPASLDVAALRSGSSPWIIGTAAAIGLFASVTVHELGHSFVAMRYGLTIDSITLWIFGGVASMEIPREWNREFWIALAGPTTSVLLGLAFYGAIQVVPSSAPIALFVFGWLAIINVVLAAFNLLPAFPMDGGRVLRALLARSRPYVQATNIAAAIGRGFAILLAVLGVLSLNVILVLVSLFVYGAAATESRSVAASELLHGVTVGDLMSTDLVTAREDASIDAFVDQMLRDHHSGYPVVDGAGNIVGIVTLQDVRNASGPDREALTVGDIMSHELLTVTPDADALDVLQTFSENDVGRVLVEENGDIVGIVSRTDFITALNVLRETREVTDREPRTMRQ